jgi:dipeptidyl aminopeptidase/acylaminoacyl peptidase
MKRILVAVLLSVTAVMGVSQTSYKTPPEGVIKILDAPPTPQVQMSPAGNAMLLMEMDAHPPIEVLAQPMLRLAGLRINPELHSSQRTTQYTGFIVHHIGDNRQVRMDLPAGARMGRPAWSYDGAMVSFTLDSERGVHLWVADVKSGRAKELAGVRVNDILGTPFQWMADHTTLLVQLVPPGAGAPPEKPRRPAGPIIEETAGRAAQVVTYQDLLGNPHDEDLFEYYGTSQLASVNTQTGAIEAIGTPGLYTSVQVSPDGRYILVHALRRPFSYRVPYSLFTRATEVWDRGGRMVTTIADLPISDDIPRQGVVVGPRGVRWQPLKQATLVWLEALDDGDPLKKVPHRDKLMRLAAPFTAAPVEVMKLQHRFAGMDWTARADEVIIAEFDRDRRWRTTALVDLRNPQRSRSILFDMSANEVYNDPGQLVYETRPDGQSVVAHDGDWVYYASRGATESGDRPALDRFNLKTKKKERLYQSKQNTTERFVSFLGADRGQFVTRFESQTEPPNYFLVDLRRNTRAALTSIVDPAPQLTGMSKQLLRYTRADGVPLSGTLYLPPGYNGQEKLPLVVWAYPREYSDDGTAGQVRSAPNTFTFLRGTSPLFFVTQGYAVLMDATMPVVGDPETMNDTFVEQIVAAAKAAIDVVDSMSIIDRHRVVVGGHSYGAFMTANLLAHSDLFAAGIARSGAYNRSLTPFGFQSERRSFWEATDVYMRVSPFTHAHKINEPILIIHGEADNNPGTYTMQSERLFAAIKGNGGTARLVLLPHESHGYVARESVLHTLAEMFEWADTHAKNRRVEVGSK